MFQLLVYLYITRLRICLDFCFKIQALTIGGSKHFANMRLSKKNSNVEKGEGRGRNYIFSIQLLPAWMLYKHPVQHQIHPDIFILKIYIFWSKACQVDSERNIIQSTRVIQHKCAIHKSNPIQHKCYTRTIHSARAIQCKSLQE